MPSSITIDKYTVRENKKGDHLIRLTNNTKRMHVISDNQLCKLLYKYCGVSFGKKKVKENVFPDCPIKIDDRMNSVNKEIQKLKDKKSI